MISYAQLQFGYSSHHDMRATPRTRAASLKSHACSLPESGHPDYSLSMSVALFLPLERPNSMKADAMFFPFLMALLRWMQLVLFHMKCCIVLLYDTFNNYTLCQECFPRTDKSMICRDYFLFPVYDCSCLTLQI